MAPRVSPIGMVLLLAIFVHGNISAEPYEDHTPGADANTPFDFKSWAIDPALPERQRTHSDSKRSVSRPDNGDALTELERLPEWLGIQHPEEVNPVELGAKLLSSVRVSASGNSRYTRMAEHATVSVDRPSALLSLNTVSLEMAQYEPTVPAGTHGGATACSSPVLPFNLRRSIAFWRQTEDGAACSAAVKDIRSLRAEMMLDQRDDLHDVKLFDPKYICDSRYRHVKTIVERYVNSCLYRLSDAVRLNLLTEKNTEIIFASIGIFEGIGQKCVGTIANGHVYTSRHCFLSWDAKGKPSLRFPSQDFYLHTFAGGKFKLAVPGTGTDTGFADGGDDWIYLPFAPNQTRPTDEIALRPDLASPWRALIMISLHRYLVALNACGQSAKTNKELAVEAIAVDITPGCTIFGVDGNIVYHGCQTQKGMSGTPLVTIVDDQLALVAIHSGASSALQTECARKLIGGFSNYGVVPQVRP